MKKTVTTALAATLILCSIGATTLFAAEETTLPPDGANIGAEGMFGGGGRHGGMMFGGEMTEEQLAEMEAERTAREEKLNAFIAGLSADQKALYDAMTPSQPAEGQEFVRPGETAIQEMQANREAFIAALTEEQKTEYESLNMGRGGFGGFNAGREMTDEDRAAMEERRALYDEKYDAFVDTLDESQKAAFDELNELSRRPFADDSTEV